MHRYLYWWAVDQPQEPWTGPYRSQRQAVLAGSRDGNQDRVLFIRAGLVLGPDSAWVEQGVERVPPEAR
jgi:hypothetical protein